MPFDPAAYLAKKQSSNAQQTGAEAPAAFDPKAYLASKNVQTDQPPAAQPGAAAKAMDAYVGPAEVAGQGAALGYGAQLNAGMQAGMGAVDQAVNGQNNFGDQSPEDGSLLTRLVDAVSNLPKNYSIAKKGVQDQIDKARSTHPVAAALGEIASSVPASIAASAAFGAAGITSSIAQAGSIAAAYGYGVSRNEGMSRIEDAAKAGALGAGIAGGFKAAGAAASALKDVPDAIADLAASEYENYGKPIISIAKAAVNDTPYGLDFAPKLGESFQIGKEMKQVLTDPNVQAQVTSELNAQPRVVQGIIDQTKARLGTLWNPIIVEHGDISTPADTVLNKAYNTAKDVAVEGDQVAQGLQEALFSKIKNFASNLISKDPVTGVGGDVNLSQLTEAQESLGNAIYRDEQFQKAPGVEAAAKRIWGQLADAASKLDETKGSGGQLGEINKVYKALYGMQDNMIKGTDVRAMVNPQSVGAENRFEQFVKPFQDLPANLRLEFAPEMHEYLSQDFPKVFAKAKTMVAATTGKDNSLISKVLNMAGLRALKPINIANRAGQMSNIQYNGPSTIPAGVQAAPAVVAPSIGGQGGTGR